MGFVGGVSEWRLRRVPAGICCVPGAQQDLRSLRRKIWITTAIMMEFALASVQASLLRLGSALKSAAIWNFSVFLFRGNECGHRHSRCRIDDETNFSVSVEHLCTRPCRTFPVNVPPQGIDAVRVMNHPYAVVTVDETELDSTMITRTRYAPRHYRSFGLRRQGSGTRTWVIAAIASSGACITALHGRERKRIEIPNLISSPRCVFRYLFSHHGKHHIRQRLYRMQVHMLACAAYTKKSTTGASTRRC